MRGSENGWSGKGVSGGVVVKKTKGCTTMEKWAPHRWTLPTTDVPVKREKGDGKKKDEFGGRNVNASIWKKEKKCSWPFG